MTHQPPAGIVAVVRAATPQIGLTIATGLAAAGVDGVEITFTVPDAADVIRQLAGRVTCPVGAGTVRTVADCQAAADAGATFIVSPDLNEKVVERAHSLGLAAVPGALTPGEIGRCLDLGAEAVKVFPVSSVGGPGYIKAIAEPFPGVDWVASGGVQPHDAQAYIDAGCLAVCMGGALIDSAAAMAGDVDGVAAHARDVLATARER